MTHELPASVRRGYALGSVATGAYGTVPGLLLLPFLTDHIGIAAAAAGVVVVAPKVWDVLIDPFIGRITDRAPRPRRRPFLLRGGVALALAFVLLFAGPTSPDALAVGWVVVAFLTTATAFSFFQVPYLAMAAEITLDYTERTRLMTWRVAVLALVILLSGATAPIVADEFGHRAMGVYVAAIILVGVLGAWWGTRDAEEHEVETAPGTLREQLAIVGSSSDFRALLGTFVVQAIGIGTLLAGVAYVADDVLDSTLAAALLFVFFVGPALVVTPLWGRWFPVKKTGFIVASGFIVAGSLALLAARAEWTVAVYVAAALVGVGYAGAQVFPMAMLPDVAAHDAATSGENRNGVFTGVWTAGETLGLALGPGVFALVLALGGYVPGRDAIQPESALTAITIGFSVVPALIVAASLLILSRYRLDDQVTHGR